MSDTVKKLHLTPGQMRDAVARAAEDVKTLPPWREPKETTMADKHNIGPTIRARRESANLTQSALARKLGCADTMISRWESGRATPRQRYAEKLAVALGGVAADYHERSTPMNWTPYTLECAVSAAPVDPATKRPTLRGVDNREQSVTVWMQPFNLGFDVLRKGVIHSMGARDAVAYLNAFGFVPGGAEVPK